MFKQLLSVFLESRCGFCQRTTTATLCQYCFKKLASYQFESEKPTIKLAPSLGISAPDLPVFAWGKYDGELKRAIALMKYNNQPEIGRVLGKLLAQAWLEHNLINTQSKITVVPIPLHRKKLKERGFNQAEIIAISFCTITGYDLNTKALVRRRNTQAMFDLSPTARVKNIQNAFCLSRKLPKYPVLLLDDIYTLGTTIKASAKVLQQQKIKVIGAVVTAQTGKSSY